MKTNKENTIRSSSILIINMSKMRKFLRTKLRSAFSKLGFRSHKERGGGSSFPSKLSVNEEYLEVFRTKSYVEMWDKVHRGQVPRASRSSSTTRFSSSSSSLPTLYLDHHLSENLLEPRQETLNDMMNEGRFNLHHLLTEYFEASLEACHICELLLRSIHQTRANYRSIKKVMIKLSQSQSVRQHNHYTSTIDDEQCRAIFGELNKFAHLKSPLSIISPMKFRDIHDDYLALLRRLTSKHEKIQRRAKRNRICKKVGGVALVVSHSALLIALLVFAFHSMIGLVAAPALVACSMGLCKRKMESVEEWLNKRLHESLGHQLDVAAKGVYILINDFDTMSRMVRRLDDEVEHRKAVSVMCVRNGNCEMMKEVVREFHARESSFLEQLEELEEHIYLCLLTINRSRRLLIQEIMEIH